MTMHRPANGAPIAGVCAALAERTGIDPLIIRVAAILLAVSSGIGLVLYVAGWLLIPREGHDLGILLETFPALATVPRWALLSILAVVLVAVAIPVGQVTPTSSFPAVVIGLVYYFSVYRPRHGRGAIDSRRDRASGTMPPGPPQSPGGALPPARPFGSPAQGAASVGSPTEADIHTVVRPPASGDASTGAAGTHAGQRAEDPRRATAAGPQASPSWAPDPAMSSYLTQPDPIGLYAPPPPTPRAARLPDPQRLGKRTLGLVTLTTLGLLWTWLSLAATAGHPIPLFIGAAAALVIVGGSLVVGAWVGRPRGLISAAVILALLATAGAYHTDHPVPQPLVAPDSVTYVVSDTMPVADSWDFGAPTIDLRGLDLRHDTTYDVHMNAGSVTILIPESARVVVHGRVAVGPMTLGDWSSDQPPAEGVTRLVSPGRPGAPTLTINASTEVGELVVKP
ncbi:PspC domain-containing protein [Raineyella antarctica]|nr:PspC domain-containing protein [Raineyella antarctica]